MSQHPELLDEGLVHMMKQVAAQLSTQGSQEIAIYLKHLAAEIHHGWLQPNERRGRSSISSPSPNNASLDRELQPANGHNDLPIDPGVATASKLHPEEGQFVAANPTPRSSPLIHRQIDAPIDPGVATVNNRHSNESRTQVAAPMPRSAPPNNQIEELLANISSRLEKLEVSTKQHSTPYNPLWYMPILEQVDTHGWIISSEEVEQLIGMKPHCAPGHNSFVRGCWKFVKAGKVGMHSSWRVTKETTTLPIVGVDTTAAIYGSLTPTAEASPSDRQTPEPDSTELELDLSSPWTDN